MYMSRAATDSGASYDIFSTILTTPVAPQFHLSTIEKLTCNNALCFPNSHAPLSKQLFEVWLNEHLVELAILAVITTTTVPKLNIYVSKYTFPFVVVNLFPLFSSFANTDPERYNLMFVSLNPNRPRFKTYIRFNSKIAFSTTKSSSHVFWSISFYSPKVDLELGEHLYAPLQSARVTFELLLVR